MKKVTRRKMRDEEKNNNSNKNAVAELLGKARAEQTKRSKEVLDFYLK